VVDSAEEGEETVGLKRARMFVPLPCWRAFARREATPSEKEGTLPVVESLCGTG
jgi:hypothetical protein